MVIETLSFRLADEVDENRFRQIDRQVQEEILPDKPGFLRRTTARNDDGEWIVVVLWSTEEEALAASAATEGDPVMAAFSAALDIGTVHHRRYATLD